MKRGVDYDHIAYELIKGLCGYFVWKHIKNDKRISENDVLIVLNDYESVKLLEQSWDKLIKYRRFKKVVLCVKKGVDIRDFMIMTGIESDNIVVLTRLLFDLLLTFYKMNNMSLPIIMCSLNQPIGRNLGQYAELSGDYLKIFQIGVLGLID